MTQGCSAVEHYVEKVTIWGDVKICYWGLCSEGLIGTFLKELHAGNLWVIWGLYLGIYHGGIC